MSHPQHKAISEGPVEGYNTVVCPWCDSSTDFAVTVSHDIDGPYLEVFCQSHNGEESCEWSGHISIKQELSIF